MIKKALILAAGKGNRMWPLTENKPKPLLPIVGKSIIEKQIIELKKAGVTEVNVLIGYKMNKISDKIGNGDSFVLRIYYIVQEKQKGTGHAVNQMKDKISEPFYCLNGDILINQNNIQRLLDKKEHIVMMTTEVKDGTNFGAVKSKNGYLISIKEKGVSGKTSINAGIYLFNSGIFKALANIKKSIRGEYELTDALESIAGDVKVVEYEGFWKDIGSPWDLLTANEKEICNVNEKNEGIIEENVTLNGTARIGKGTILKSGTYVEGSVWIGDNCIIGPNAYLRNGTVLCGNNKVGASSEVKNSILMEGAKAPHHNYVGDSILGENCNLGSGTKIANLRLDKNEIVVVHRGKKVNTKRRKLGAIIGDNTKTGINTSINSGTILGSNVKIGPSAIVSGTYESQSTII